MSTTKRNEKRLKIDVNSLPSANRSIQDATRFASC
jgi:hypothetical protein